jgi:arylformamidase
MAGGSPQRRRRGGALTALAAALVALAAAAGPAGAATAHPDLSYDLDGAPDAANRLDLYTPDGARPKDDRPVVVYVHGGAWAVGDKANRIADKVRLFTGAGDVFASVNYRLSPSSGEAEHGRVMFPDQPHDVGEAVAWLGRHVARYGGDPTRIVLIGHSAGAHLVALVSTDPRYLRAYGFAPWKVIGTIALDSDAYDIPARIAGGTRRARQILYNAFGTPAENARSGAWATASPITWADPTDPRALFVTQAANPARATEAGWMATALGQDPTATVFRAPYDHEGINAAVGNATDSAGETARIVRFVARRIAVSKGPHIALRRHPRHRIRTHRHRVRVRFAFSTRAAGATFRCRVDRHRSHPCHSPHIAALGRAPHRFRVRAIAPSGRPGPMRNFRLRIARVR